MVDTTYNGWSNYETWLVNLHFDVSFEDNVSAKYIKEFIEDWVHGYFQLHGIKEDIFLQDVLNTFLSNVNYHELAEHYKYED